MTDFATKLGRLMAAVVEYRASAIDIGVWLGANVKGPHEEVDSLATCQAIAGCFETANAGASALLHHGNVQRSCAELVHGRSAVKEAIAHGHLLARGNCPCESCAGERADGVTTAQAIHAAALATPTSTTGEPS